MTTTRPTEPSYMMGRSDEETRRLIQQSQFFNRPTRQLLVEAGISAGMQVLDLGSGAGDVAMLAAELVGPNGSVTGLDLNAAILTTARQRSEDAGFSNITFIADDFATYVPAHQFDAIIGRLVLMYVPNAPAVLARLAEHLRSGGVAAFQDYNFLTHSVDAYPTGPLLYQMWAWARAVVASLSIHEAPGYHLKTIFREAGLPAPAMHIDAILATGETARAGAEYVGETLRSLLPLILKFGIATEDEIDIDTFTDRVHAEVIAHDTILKSPDLVSAWVRVD